MVITLGGKCDDVVVRQDITVRSDDLAPTGASSPGRAEIVVPIQGWPHSHPDWGDGPGPSARHNGDMDKSLISDRLRHPSRMPRLDGSVI